MRKNVKYLTAIILTSIILRMLILTIYPPHYDDTAHLYFAREIISEHSYRFFFPNAQSYTGAEPVYWYMLLFLVNPLGLFGVKIFNVLIGGLTTFVIFLIGKEVFNEKVGIISSLLHALNPENMYWNTLVWRNNLDILLVSVALYTIIIAFKTKETKYYIYSSVLFSLAIYTYSAPILWLPLFTILAIYKKKFNKNFLIFLFLLFLLATPIIILRLENKNDAQVNRVWKLYGEVNINQLKNRIFRNYDSETGELYNLFLLKNFFGKSKLSYDQLIHGIIIVALRFSLILFGFLYLIKYRKRSEVLTLAVITSILLYISLSVLHGSAMGSFTFTLFIATGKVLDVARDNKVKLLIILYVLIGFTSIFFQSHIYWRSYGMKTVSEFLNEKNYTKIFSDEQMGVTLRWYLGAEKEERVVIYPNLFVSNSTLFTEEAKETSTIGCSAYVTWINYTSNQYFENNNKFNLEKTIYYKEIPIINVFELCNNQILGQI